MYTSVELQSRVQQNDNFHSDGKDSLEIGMVTHDRTIGNGLLIDSVAKNGAL